MKILLIEDELDLAEIVKDYLSQQGYEVTLLADGKTAVALILGQSWDLVLLDLMLPGQDGISICQQVRQHSTVPIIMLTARVEEVDRLIGLEVGADDYICKPYSPREVVARVKAVLRRSHAGSAAASQQFHMDESLLQVSYGGSHIELTLIEWRILSILASTPKKIFSRDQIISQAYHDYRVVNDRTIDSHINKLRKKMASTLKVDPIVSVYGAGYRFELTFQD